MQHFDENTGFNIWGVEWLRRHERRISMATSDSYHYTLRLLLRTFGARPLKMIKAMDIEDYLYDLQDQGYSDSQISKCRGMLFQIFQKAVANDILQKNPVQYADKIRRRGPKKSRDAYTAAEIELLDKNLPHDKMGMSIRLMIATGIRMQELLALEPRLIEPDGSILHIVQAVKLSKGKPYVGPTKSEASVRDVPVPLNLRIYAKELRDAAGDQKYIWQSSVDVRPYDPSHFRKTFKEYVALVGVRVLTPHSCRHTYVSQMQALGVDISTIQALVGHAAPEMTMHYLHVQPTVIMEAVSKYDGLFADHFNT